MRYENGSFQKTKWYIRHDRLREALDFRLGYQERFRSGRKGMLPALPGSVVQENQRNGCTGCDASQDHDQRRDHDGDCNPVGLLVRRSWKPGVFWVWFVHSIVLSGKVFTRVFLANCVEVISKTRGCCGMKAAEPPSSHSKSILEIASRIIVRKLLFSSLAKSQTPQEKIRFPGIFLF
jgi:hypothetical protein